MQPGLGLPADLNDESWKKEHMTYAMNMEQEAFISPTVPNLLKHHNLQNLGSIRLTSLAKFKPSDIRCRQREDMGAVEVRV